MLLVQDLNICYFLYYVVFSWNHDHVHFVDCRQNDAAQWNVLSLGLFPGSNDGQEQGFISCWKISDDKVQQQTSQQEKDGEDEMSLVDETPPCQNIRCKQLIPRYPGVPSPDLQFMTFTPDGQIFVVADTHVWISILPPLCEDHPR